MDQASGTSDRGPGGVLYTDIDEFCCRALRARIDDGTLPAGDVQQRDIRSLGANDLRYNHIHLFAGIGGFPLGMSWAGWPLEWPTITGGFPCQDVSVAGAGAGIAEGTRSGLWMEMRRVIDLVRHLWVFIENVLGLRNRGLDRVLNDLERMDYEAWPIVLDGACVGAPMRGRRIFIVARRKLVSTDGARRQGPQWIGLDRTKAPEGRRRPVLEPVRSVARSWPVGPDEVGRIPLMADGISGVVSERRAKIEAIGNSIMPQFVEILCRSVMRAVELEAA